MNVTHLIRVKSRNETKRSLQITANIAKRNAKNTNRNELCYNMTRANFCSIPFAIIFRRQQALGLPVK